MTRRVQDIITKGRKARVDHPDYYLDTDEHSASEFSDSIRESQEEIDDLEGMIQEYRRLEAEIADLQPRLEKAEEDLSEVFRYSEAGDADDAEQRIGALRSFISEASRYA